MQDNTINDDMTMGGATGTLLAGRYRVVRQLGQGGMGSVWLAEDTKLDGFKVAIKMLPSVLVNNKRAYAQVKSEALVSLKLSHPNIATVRAFEEESGSPFLVMDYIDGQTLDDYLAEKGKLTEDEAVRLLKPIAAALDYAHTQGVVHRDVKPGNVMIRKDGTPFVLDFGIAREIQETMTRVTGKLSSGTLLYMSPEQLNGDAPKPAQDIYSFAAMAYECLSGRPPFERGAIEHQILNVPPKAIGEGKLADKILQGLAKRPSDRCPTCGALLVTLEGSSIVLCAEGQKSSTPKFVGTDRYLQKAQAGLDAAKIVTHVKELAEKCPLERMEALRIAVLEAQGEFSSSSGDTWKGVAESISDIGREAEAIYEDYCKQELLRSQAVEKQNLINSVSEIVQTFKAFEDDHPECGMAGIVEEMNEIKNRMSHSEPPECKTLYCEVEKLTKKGNVIESDVLSRAEGRVFAWIFAFGGLMFFVVFGCCYFYRPSLHKETIVNNPFVGLDDPIAVRVGDRALYTSVMEKSVRQRSIWKTEKGARNEVVKAFVVRVSIQGWAEKNGRSLSSQEEDDVTRFAEQYALDGSASMSSVVTDLFVQSKCKTCQDFVNLAISESEIQYLTVSDPFVDVSKGEIP